MTSKVYARIGRRVQALRRARGLTQAELAERADMALSYLVKVEGGTRKARIEVLERLAEALGEPLSALFADARSTKAGGELGRLAELLGLLGEEDVRALLGVASRLARYRQGR